MSRAIAMKAGTRPALPASDGGRVASTLCARDTAIDSARRPAEFGSRSHALRALVVGVGLLLAVPAASQVSATRDYLQRMDTDGNGRVSLSEYQAWMGYAFERMDRNGDGMLTPDELPGGRGKPVSLVAHRAALAATFARQDRNRDGALDARELAAPPQ